MQGFLTLIYFKYCQLPNFAAATILTNKFSTSSTKIPSVALKVVVVKLSKLCMSLINLSEYEDTASKGKRPHLQDFLAFSLIWGITKMCLVTKIIQLMCFTHKQ